MMPQKPANHAPLSPLNKLHVYLEDNLVGTLARTADGKAAFQYDAAWLRSGFSISPRSLPLEEQVFVADWQPFGGLFGVFNDSLPDGWGALLLDRMLASQGIDPASLGPLERLSLVGKSGRGALHYVPEADFSFPHNTLDLDELAQRAAEIFEAHSTDNLDSVYAAGGSSGGARPKAYYKDEDGEWLVKFPSHIDPPDIGVREYEYMVCAKQCSIQVPTAKLFPSKRCSGYFATQRFDRKDGKRIHMVSASGLLEVSHRIPSIDYQTLFQLSYFLTQGKREAEELFKRACFNVFAHNYDDHSNNFSWLCEEGAWHIAPAYDLTYSTTAFGGHTTTVMGKETPTADDLLALAAEAGLAAQQAKRIVRDIQDACAELLGQQEE